MFACWAEFAGHPPASPQHLGTVMRSAIWTNAFSRFFAQADSLNAFNLLFGVVVSFFCFHCQSPWFELWSRGRELQEAARIVGQYEVPFDSELYLTDKPSNVCARNSTPNLLHNSNEKEVESVIGWQFFDVICQ